MNKLENPLRKDTLSFVQTSPVVLEKKSNALKVLRQTNKQKRDIVELKMKIRSSVQLSPSTMKYRFKRFHRKMLVSTKNKNLLLLRVFYVLKDKHDMSVRIALYIIISIPIEIGPYIFCKLAA